MLREHGSVFPVKREILAHEDSQANGATQPKALVMAVPKAYRETAAIEARAQVHHADLAKAKSFDQLLDHGDVGNWFVGCCPHGRCHPGQFFPSQLGAVGAQSHGRSWGRYGAENCPNWLILLDKGCLLHRNSSKNGNRESQQTKRSATLPSWLCRFRRLGAHQHRTLWFVQSGS